MQDLTLIAYESLVEALYREHFWSVYGNQIEEYSSAEKTLKGLGWQLYLRQALDYGIQNQVNPYNYLDRYLTPEEIKRSGSLPFGSKEQIDLMISMADEFEICDNEIRQKVYQIFRLASEHHRNKRLKLIRGFAVSAFTLFVGIKLFQRRKS